MRRCGLLGVALAIATLVFVPAAAAANPVPNPGFEDGCGAPPAPCRWTAGQRDEENPHNGMASLQMPLFGPAVVPTSDCASASLTPGPQTLSFWYRSSPELTRVAGSVDFYSDGTCTSYLSSAYFEEEATADGEWHPASGIVNVPASVQGMTFGLSFAASGSPPDPSASINYDDVVLGAPTAVTVTRFRAERGRDGVRLRWHSASEVGIVAYEVLRTGPGRATRIVRGLVPAAGRPGAYSLVDRTARAAATYSYALRSVGPDGSRTTLRTILLAE